MLQRYIWYWNVTKCNQTEYLAFPIDDHTHMTSIVYFTCCKWRKVEWLASGKHSRDMWRYNQLNANWGINLNTTARSMNDNGSCNVSIQCMLCVYGNIVKEWSPMNIQVFIRIDCNKLSMQIKHNFYIFSWTNFTYQFIN